MVGMVADGQVDGNLQHERFTTSVVVHSLMGALRHGQRRMMSVLPNEGNT